MFERSAKGNRSLTGFVDHDQCQFEVKKISKDVLEGNVECKWTLKFLRQRLAVTDFFN